jgi:hypothetical protein
MGYFIILNVLSLTNLHHRQADDELDNPYLAGFEWDKEESYTKFIVHQKATGEAPVSSGKKKKNKSVDESAS